MRNIDNILHHYLVAALWSSTECDEDGNNCRPLDDNYSADDIAPKTVAESRADIEDFLSVTAGIDSSEWTDEQFGHDFWLTRCGHGAGFWDRGHGEAGDKLADFARIAGNVDMYVGDDGRVYSC